MWGLPKDGEEEKTEEIVPMVQNEAEMLDVDKIVEDQWD